MPIIKWLARSQIFRPLLTWVSRLLSQPSEIDEPCDCLPLEIPDEALIARAVFFDSHVTPTDRLKWQLFKPPVERDDLSVMRLACVPPTDCKRRAKAMIGQGRSYRGFAVMRTGSIRSEGAKVRDSREGNFCGHGDILLGVKRPRTLEGEPGSEQDQLDTYRYKAICKELLKHCNYVIDPEPNTNEWPAHVLLIGFDNEHPPIK